jgi:uncharacterized damage-inducible protein DinB
MENSFCKEFNEQCVYRNEENTKRIIQCLEKISETEIWKTPNESSNSMANIILHLCGNITQYLISALGNYDDHRERDKEFSTRGGYNKAELIHKLSATVAQANDIIRHISEEALMKRYSVQGFNLSGIGIIIHVTEHYSYHTGQVAFWVKEIKNIDLGFYAGTDLNLKNIH